MKPFQIIDLHLHSLKNFSKKPVITARICCKTAILPACVGLSLS